MNPVKPSAVLGVYTDATEPGICLNAIRPALQRLTALFYNAENVREETRI